MSISIITINDYKTRYPDSALSGIRDARIQSAINLSFSYLDVKTGCAISQRWNIVEPAAGYLTAEQKAFVAEAMYVETQYIISNNMDFSQGAEQTSFGSLSVSSSRPSRKEVCDAALLYLQKAGLYDYLQFSSLSYAGHGNGGSITSFDDIDPQDQPLPARVSDARYVHKNQGVSYAGKFLYVDSNGNVALTDAGLDPSTYYTKLEVDNKIYPLQQRYDQLGLGYLKSVSKDTINKTITITDYLGQLVSFPYAFAEIGEYLKSASVSADHTTLYITDKDGNILSYNPTLATGIQDVKQNGTTVVDPATKIANIDAYTEAETDALLLNKISLLPDEPISHQPYNFATHFVISPTATEINGTIYTITLDNNHTAKTWPISIPAVSTSTAGVMSANDKTKLDSITDTSKIVYTDTNQTISGNKSFTGNVETNDIVKVKSTVTTDAYANYCDNGIVYSSDGTTSRQFTWPDAAGQLALKSDIPTPATNLVTTDTQQNITAMKTFSSTGNIASIKLMTTNTVTGRLSISGTGQTRNSVPTFAYEPEINEGIYNINLPEKNGTLLTNEGTPSGIVLTGSYVFDFIGDQLKRQDTTQAFNITGGTSSSNGASISLCGSTMGSNEGNFSLTANNGTTSKALVGKPDGTLTWNGNALATTANVYTKTEVNTKLTDGSVTKVGTATKGSATQPIYLNAGTPTAGTTYAGGTNVTLNGTGKSGSTASFYAPTAAGTSGQYLKSSGGAPAWNSFGLGTWTNVAWSGSSGVVFAPASGFTFSTASGHSNKYRTDTLGRIEVSLRTTITTSNSISANSFLQIGTLNKKNGSMDVWVVASVLVGGKYYSLPMHITDGGAVYLSNTTASALSLSGAQLQVSFFTA